MQKSVTRLIEQLNQYQKDSSILEVKEEWLAEIENKYPRMPEDLKELYLTLGYGSIASSSYMIHIPTEPDEIYDEETAKGLEGILIVGDDFSGTCEAYNAKQGWLFGTIGSHGQFEEYGPEVPGLVHFLIDWFVEDK
ncbi:hypothetical protein [Gimesia fumaroli]|nr:hypothetical protein [Gimesia fumaroli]